MKLLHSENEVVQDVDRPDINQKPKMWELGQQLVKALEGVTVPFLTVSTSDNLMSGIWVVGSFDKKESWEYGIFENSKGFKIFISAEKGKRYYTPGDRVTVEWSYIGFFRDSNGFHTLTHPRKSTTTPEKAFEKIRKWLCTPQ